MKSYIVSVGAICAICGCSQQAPNATPAAPATPNAITGDAAEAPAAPTVPTQDAFPIPEAPTPTISDADRPSTIDAFVADFIRRYQDNMYAPFIELAYWGSSTNEQKKEYLAGIRETYMYMSQGAPATIKSPDDIEIVPVAEYEAAYYPKQGEESVRLIPEPTHILGITGHVGASKGKMQPNDDEEDDGGLEVTNYFAVGVHDGKFYFCTVKHD